MATWADMTPAERLAHSLRWGTGYAQTSDPSLALMQEAERINQQYGMLSQQAPASIPQPTQQYLGVNDIYNPDGTLRYLGFNNAYNPMAFDEINARRAASGDALFTPESYDAYVQARIEDAQRTAMGTNGTGLGTGLGTGTPYNTNTPTTVQGEQIAAGGQTVAPIDFEGQGVDMTSRAGTPFMDAYIRARESAQAKGPVSGLFANELNNNG